MEGAQLELDSASTAAAGSRGKTERQRRIRTTRGLMRCLKHDAARLCDLFSLRYRSLEAERAGVRSRYGACFSDGTIKIRLYHAGTGRPLKYSSLIDTLCHELAHLRHFNHGAQFQELYQRILEGARRERIYRPGPGAPRIRPATVAAPAARIPTGRTVARDQLSLFG